MAQQTDIETSFAKLSSGFYQSSICKIQIQEKNLVLLSKCGDWFLFVYLVLPRTFYEDVYLKPQIK